MTGDSGNGPHETVKDTLAQLTLEDRGTVLADAIQTLPDQLQKDVATETAKALPDQLQKDVAADTTNALPDEVKRDVVNTTVQGMPMADKKDVATRALQDLSSKDRQDVAGNPSQQVTDKIWLTIVRTFSAVLFASALGLLYVSIWPPQGETNPTQVMLPVFTSIAGILAGFIGGRASAGG